MKHEGVIVTQLTGKQIPKQYLEYAIANRTGYIGVAIPDTKKGGVMHISGSQFGLDDVLSSQQDCKDDPQVWYFARHDEDLNHDDMQPHVLLRSAGNEPLICCFLAGEYEPDFTHKESKHTNDFFVVQEYLIGKVAQVYTQCGNNLGLTVKELKQPTLFKEILRTCRKSAESPMQITMIAAEGSVWSYSTMQPSTFEWGSATEAFGFTEKASDPPPAEKKSGMFGSPSGTPAVAPLPASVPQVPDKTNPLPGENSTGWETFKNTLFVPPEHIIKNGRHALKNWYKHWGVDGDKLPEKWEKGTAAVKIREQMLKQIDVAIAGNKVKVQQELPVIASTDPVKPVINSETSKQVPSILSMVAAPEKRAVFEKELLSRVICTRDEKGQVIIDPNKLAEWEKNLPTVAEQMGKKDEQLVFDVDAARATIDKFPEFALRQWLMEQSQKVLLANQLAAAHAELAELKTKNVRAGMFGKTG